MAAAPDILVAAPVTASAHTAVLLGPAVDALNMRADGHYVDATYGRGGHSAAILDRLGPTGRLDAFDKDLAACQAGWPAAARDHRLHLHHAGFETLAAWADDAGFLGRIDGILLDLGVSSPQLDDAQRGFSFQSDGPLDMRMDVTAGETAAQWLARAPEREIADVLYRYGDERASRRIARTIVTEREDTSITRTAQLAEIIARHVRRTPGGSHPATRSFQAIRIHINQEVAALESVLAASLDVLADGGVLSVISFHSLEDRIVKRFMRHHANPPLPPVAAAPRPEPGLEITAWQVRADAAEARANPRARSATLRAAIRRRSE